MNYKILAINPGSTSTKIALYENEKEIFTTTLEHPNEEIEKYDNTQDQFEMRKDVVFSYLEGKNFDIKELSAVVGRGGMLPSVKSGAYVVNKLMLDTLKNRPVMEHASNLGAPIHTK